MNDADRLALHNSLVVRGEPWGWHVGCTGCEAEWCGGSGADHPTVPWLPVSARIPCPEPARKTLTPACLLCKPEGAPCLRCGAALEELTGEARKDVFFPDLGMKDPGAPLFRCRICRQTYVPEADYALRRFKDG